MTHYIFHESGVIPGRAGPSYSHCIVEVPDDGGEPIITPLEQPPHLVNLEVVAEALTTEMADYHTAATQAVEAMNALIASGAPEAAPEPEPAPEAPPVPIEPAPVSEPEPAPSEPTPVVEPEPEAAPAETAPENTESE